ncbi:MAG: aminotransferase class V-fold PLP-dependent enzyme, partial [Leptospiraceae bacterium]|nr:aminotransferase class V-fold PLP-dependent enzyme [Leptospiraceae bacterium]
MPDFAALRRAFSLREDLIWLNNCGVSVPPRSSADAVCQYLEAFMASGVLQRVKPHAALKNKIQSYLAKFLGGKPHNYALLNNTAEGMTFIAQSLPLNAGDAILLVEREYPSNVYPFLQLQKNGVTVRFVAPGFSNEEFIHNIKQAITPKVRAMALSAVDWLTGLKFDLARIGALLKEYGIFFLLDAAQGAGHVSIGVQELKVDAMAFSCWKWLLGPLGSGALYVSDDFMAKLDIRVAGTSSVKNDEQYLPYREDYKETAERFMLSTAPYLNWVFLENSLAFLDSIGLDAVMVRLMELAEQLTTI